MKEDAGCELFLKVYEWGTSPNDWVGFARSWRVKVTNAWRHRDEAKDGDYIFVELSVYSGGHWIPEFRGWNGFLDRSDSAILVAGEETDCESCEIVPWDIVPDERRSREPVHGGYGSEHLDLIVFYTPEREFDLLRLLLPASAVSPPSGPISEDEFAGFTITREFIDSDLDKTGSPFDIQPLFSIGYHAAITKSANEGQLSEQQLALVVAANKAQDLRQANSAVHFDNCAFAESIEYIENEWQLIEEVGAQSGDAALAAFGRLLHTTQDFYAHSNWIELHVNESPIPIWDQKLNSLPSAIVSGTWWLGRPKQCRSNAPTHNQLNKDSHDSREGSKVVDTGPNQGKKQFELAFTTAVDACRQQFQRLATMNLAPVTLFLKDETNQDMLLNLVTATLSVSRLKQRPNQSGETLISSNDPNGCE